MTVAATVLPGVSHAAVRATSYGALTAIGHARHVGTGAAVGGVILLALIAMAGIMLRRWHTSSNARRREAERRPPER
jgi:hypothetical protein